MQTVATVTTVSRYAVRGPRYQLPTHRPSLVFRSANQFSTTTSLGPPPGVPLVRTCSARNPRPCGRTPRASLVVKTVGRSGGRPSAGPPVRPHPFARLRAGRLPRPAGFRCASI